LEEDSSNGTATPDLLALSDWLESFIERVLNVPCRKTDVTDCVWIAQLLAQGLLSGSFVPEKPVRDLRELPLHRKILIQKRSREANRLYQDLQDSGINQSSVATNILGVSGGS